MQALNHLDVEQLLREQFGQARRPTVFYAHRILNVFGGVDTLIRGFCSYLAGEDNAKAVTLCSVDADKKLGELRQIHWPSHPLRPALNELVDLCAGGGGKVDGRPYLLGLYYLSYKTDEPLKLPFNMPHYSRQDVSNAAISFGSDQSRQDLELAERDLQEQGFIRCYADHTWRLRIWIGHFVNRQWSDDCRAEIVHHKRNRLTDTRNSAKELVH